MVRKCVGIMLLTLSSLVGALDFGLYLQDSAGDAIHIVDRGLAEYAGAYSLQGGMPPFCSPPREAFRSTC